MKQRRCSAPHQQAHPSPLHTNARFCVSAFSPQSHALPSIPPAPPFSPSRLTCPPILSLPPPPPLAPMQGCCIIQRPSESGRGIHSGPVTPLPSLPLPLPPPRTNARVLHHPATIRVRPGHPQRTRHSPSLPPPPPPPPPRTNAGVLHHPAAIRVRPGHPQRSRHDVNAVRPPGEIANIALKALPVVTEVWEEEG